MSFLKWRILHRALNILRSGEGFKGTVLTFLVEKSELKLLVISEFKNTRKNFKLNLVLLVVLVLESKGL